MSGRTTLDMSTSTHEEIEEALARQAVLVLPIGSVEQHGPHLPIGTDALIATLIAERIQAGRPVIVAPTYNYGAGSQPRSGGGRHFTGSIGLPTSLLAPALSRVVAEYLRTGFSRIIVLNGHMENTAAIFEALEDNLGPGGRWTDRGGFRRAVHVNWWDFVTEGHLEALLGSTAVDWGSEHAGVLETSVLESLAPHLVRGHRKVRGGALDKVPYDAFPARPETLWPNGIGSSAVDASAGIGDTIVALVTGQLRTVIEREFPLD